MNGKGSRVHRMLALHHLSRFAHQNQVRGPDHGEIHAERVDPEVVRLFRVAGGDMAGDSFVIAELGEEAESGGQALFAVETFLFRGTRGRGGSGGENRHGVWHVWDYISGNLAPD